MMLGCCLRKQRPDDCEQIVFKSADYGTINWADSFYQVNWPDCDDKGIHQITLNAIQPNAERHISTRRKSSAENETSYSRSRSTSQSESEPICSPITYPAGVSHFSPNIRESFLVSYFKAEDDEVFSGENVHQGGIGERVKQPPTVKFSLQRTPTDSGCCIQVELKAARNLPCKGRGLVYNPIAVLTLLPGNHQTQMSTRAPKTLNPNFQQTFTFSFNRSSHRYSFLRITIYDAARRKKHMSVGHAILPYVETCVKFGSPVDYELVLGKSSVIHGAIGDIYITLSYTPMEKCLTVGLLRVRHLAVTEMVGCVNKELHAKVSLLFTGENVKTMKSGIICPSSRSFINEKFRFFVPAAVFDDITLVVTLVVCSVFSDDAPIGRVTVGPYFRSGEGALNYWGVLVQTERVVKGWYTLHL